MQIFLNYNSFFSLKREFLRVFNFYHKRRFKYNKCKKNYYKNKIRHSFNYAVNLTKKFFKKNLKNIILYNLFWYFTNKIFNLISPIIKDKIEKKYFKNNK